MKYNLNYIIKATVFFLTIIATTWLIHQFCRLFFETSFVWDSSVRGGIDLYSRYREFNNWFAGFPVYGRIKTAVYPPASYLMLWPILNWGNINFIKSIFAVGFIISLVVIIRIIIKESKASDKLEKVFVGLLPLALYPVGASIGNGQLNLLIFPFLLYGIILLKSNNSDLKHDIIISFLILISLIKPNISAPFLFIVLFIPGRFRPFLIIISSYLLLTLASLSFQAEPASLVMKRWISSIYGMLFYKGYKSYEATNILLSFLVEDQWLIPTALTLFILLGIWIYIHRQIDIWILIGVIAIVTRFLSYNRWYDDILILLPIITLFRFIKNDNNSDKIKYISSILLFFSVLFTLAPGGFYLFPKPYKSVYVITQNIIYLCVLVFLLKVGWRNKNSIIMKLTA